MKLVKTHAFGNDFLLLREEDVPAGADRPSLARELCERHRGIGADGLIVYASAFAASGQPERVERRSIDVNGTPVDAITLRVGNPQCVVLGDVTEERLHSIAAR